MSSTAFYTSRVDDNGNEIEKRHTARSMTPSLNSNSGRINLSSRSCEAESSIRSYPRYVNTAAYIEKNTEGIEMDRLNLFDSKFSTPLESRSDIVPPLDLQSEENYPTARDFTYSYRKHCEATKIVLKPDQAYETWLSAKKKRLSDEAAKRKRAEEQKRKEQEQRKRLSKEKFEQWLENKSRLRKQQQQNRSPPLSTLGVNSNQSIRTTRSDIVSSSNLSTQKSLKPQLSESEVQARIAEWEENKIIEKQRQREIKRQEEQRRQEESERRREKANEAWNKWIVDAAKKPKPVPLNRGFFSLRGTVSDIFVNPNEWQHIIPVEDD